MDKRRIGQHAYADRNDDGSSVTRRVAYRGPDGLPTDIGRRASLAHPIEAVGSADVTVTATLNGESKEQVFTAEVIGGTPPPPLEVEITTGPTSIVSGTEYTWEAMASGGTSPYEYYWSYTSMQCLGTDCSYTFSPGVSTTESLKIAIETSDRNRGDR